MKRPNKLGFFVNRDKFDYHSIKALKTTLQVFPGSRYMFYCIPYSVGHCRGGN